MPIINHQTVQMAHGAGGKLSAELIEKFILPRFANEALNRLEDQATLALPAGKVAFSTDTFVVSPIFFPGGDIGDLAINGTVNDLAMSGATPLYLSVGFVLEEGFSLEAFHRVLISMENAAKNAGVRVVTGDTKVVGKNSCDKIFINTSGIGVIAAGVSISCKNLVPGDKILISGSLAEHGMAVMTKREGLSFQSEILSDTAPLCKMVEKMLAATPEIHAMRDPTRGGLATTLNEFAKSSQVGIKIYEEKVPVRDDVRGACEMLGIDPLYVANEGKLVAAVPAEKADAVLAAMRADKFGEAACIVGEVTSSHTGMVVMQTRLGANRIVDMPLGEQLPRIC
ncbi:hydrogenase expression/formation protein HypE [Chloroherpeton thalassium ATCC 35110]|uniref:Hydrogenase expression/formation protein HypE n=2 Tax=Chloroherpeton thalassium TaxID=100716 RepID=B3QTU8_CHLT3|nr:hydrogenase expression/formation protein HypE [Chloroherpeton thalassium ATCC 35110]